MAATTYRILGSLAGIFIVTALVGAADWPQWLGPNHNGSSPETGLLTAWPKEGPKVVWKVDGGDGYSSVAVAGNRAYTMVQRGKDELAVCLDVANGKELWSRRTGPAYKDKMGDGPRGTPAIEGGRVYVQSATGPLLCLDADKGTVLWEHDLLKEFKAENISWGLSASPLIEGDLVLAIPARRVPAWRHSTKSRGSSPGRSAMTRRPTPRRSW